MTEVFHVRHADPACREKLCLNDYETAFARHQEIQYQKYRGQSGAATPEQARLAESFQGFRSAIWGEGSYASRIWLRVTPAGRGPTQSFRLEDIAVGGEVLYEDLKTLAELGRVEILVPAYYCGQPSGGMAAGLEIYWSRGGDFSRADFSRLIRDLDALRPLHGEGMGNVFWFRCVEAAAPSPPPEVAPAEPPAAPAVFGIASHLMSAMLASALGEPSLSCDEEEISYYDEDSGAPVCESYPEEGAGGIAGAFGGLRQGLGAVLPGAAAGGVLYFSRFQAERIGAAVLRASLAQEDEAGE